MIDYVHGYTEREAQRLIDQADTLAALLHHGTTYTAGSRVLEAGCGTGAQSVHLVANSPDAVFTAVDRSGESLAAARLAAARSGKGRVSFHQADITALPMADDTFDDAFVCFLLEHLPAPERALAEIARVVVPGGTVTVIEGDHGTYFCHPRSPAADRVVDCLVTLQAQKGGDALIGRRLYPLLASAGCREIRVSPRMVYVDASRPQLVDGFTKNTFIAMVAGVREEALAQGLVTPAAWQAGMDALNRATAPDGVFGYTFFKATAIV
ncbi:MAG: methyltransferase domain-containing protein [Pseudomonadota bacterium]